MKNIIISITILMCCIILTYGISSQRNYDHKNKTLNAEFDNIYYILDIGKSFEQHTTAELILIVPNKEGRPYWNTDTNEMWVSTGILVNQFIHK